MFIPEILSPERQDLEMWNNLYNNVCYIEGKNQTKSL